MSENSFLYNRLNDKHNKITKIGSICIESRRYRQGFYTSWTLYIYRGSRRLHEKRQLTRLAADMLHRRYALELLLTGAIEFPS